MMEPASNSNYVHGISRGLSDQYLTDLWNASTCICEPRKPKESWKVFTCEAKLKIRPYFWINAGDKEDRVWMIQDISWEKG